MPDFRINETTQDTIIRCIREERELQDQKWGEQNHSDGEWSLILAEEVGEAATAALDGIGLHQLEEELIQVAAVAVAWLECLERLKKQEQYDEPEYMGCPGCSGCDECGPDQGGPDNEWE